MGGDLTARSELGAGATFTFWLPAMLASAESGAGTVAGLESAASRPAIAGSSRRTPPLGTAANAEPAGPPLDAAAYAVLYALSVRLAAEAETVAERYVAALRADDRFPGVRELPAVQLRDHATPFVGLLASQLMTIGETHGQAPELLGDGSQVQRVMAELHGGQRLRLGWSEADLEREMPLLTAEVERALRAAVDTAATPADATTSDAMDITGGPVDAATRYAAVVTRHVFERATRTALRAYRFAKAANAP
jgi:hypothetical protein